MTWTYNLTREVEDRHFQSFFLFTIPHIKILDCFLLLKESSPVVKDFKVLKKVISKNIGNVDLVSNFI